MKRDNNLIGLFKYDRDKILLKSLIKKLKHIPFIKEIIDFLALNGDEDVPKLIFNFTSQRFTKGYRSSLILLLDKYDCIEYIYELLYLFLLDSYNTTWYCYDVLIKYLKKLDYEDLNKFSYLITTHIIKERDKDKKQYHEMLLKKINAEIKRRKKLIQ
jgi:hypothetical protein